MKNYISWEDRVCVGIVERPTSLSSTYLLKAGHPGVDLSEVWGWARIVMAQMMELLIGRPDQYHHSPVVVEEDTVVIIDSHHVLKLCMYHDRDRMSCLGIQLDL